MKKLAMTALVVFLAGCTTTQGTNDPAAMNTNKAPMCQMQGKCCDKMKNDMAQKDGEEKKSCCCKKMCTKPKLND